LYLDRQRTVRATAGSDGVTTSASAYTDFGVLEPAAGTLYAGAGTEAAPGQEDKLAAVHLPVATTRTPVGYTGEQTNPAAGLQHYYARDYQPGLASWIQADTWAGIRTLGQTLNKYAYVLNNPTTLVDALGNRPCAYEYNNGCHDSPLVIAVNDNCSPMNGCAVDNGWTSGPGSGEPIEYGPQDGGPSYGPTPQTDSSNPSSNNGQYSGNPICNPRFVTSGTCQITGISLDPNSWLLGLGIAVGVVAAAAIVACVFATAGVCAEIGVVGGTAAAEGTVAAGEAAAVDAAEVGGTSIPRIIFGHGARHLEGTGLSVEEVESSILQKVTDAVRQATTENGSFWGRVQIRGTTIEYRAYTLPDGTINIGTYYVP
jgi:RHS repeat-associated protein